MAEIENKTQKLGIGVVALAIAAAVGAGLSDTIKEAAKSGAGKVATWAQDQVEGIFPSELPQADKDAAFSILVAKLDGDADGSQTNHVTAALRRAFDQTNDRYRIEVKRVQRVLKAGISGDIFRDHQQAEKTGQDWLRTSGAHVLVWGDVLDRNKALRLFFVLSEGTSDKRASESYKLSEGLELAKDFDQDLGLVIAARAVAAAEPAYYTGTFVADSLDELYPKLTALVGQRLVQQSKGICEMKLAVADVAATLGLQKGENRRLLEAIQGYKLVAADKLCSANQSLRPRMLIGLGFALQTLGARESDTARLDEAVAAYREALKEWTREGEPLEWATTQNNLGNALQTIGERESGTARLDEAVAAYREALKEWTRERVPLNWAMTQNNLGNSLQTLGERESGTARLDEAVAAYREALKERTRKRVPLDWAMTQNNLGSALTTLGERESGTARLDEAVTAYREALREWTRERVPLQWAATQNNLGTALQTLGARESGAARLDEAVAAFREALKERTRERVPLDWAMTQNNMGNVLLTLGERESGTVRLDEAVAAYREALTERTRERAPFLWALTQENVAIVLLTLFERSGERKTGLDALATVDAALVVYREGNAEYYKTKAESLRAKIEMALKRSG